MKFISHRFIYAVVIAAAMFIALPTTASANHSWGSYHWARPNNPFVVKLNDNVSPTWKPYLSRASYNWSRSSVLDTPIIRGTTNPTTCTPKTAQIQVCSANYGKTTWMGLAQLYVYGDHITKATVKMNDYYFNQTRFNTAGWKNLVMCQEIGHVLGLDHQDENFSNTPIGSCMDYSTNTMPNQQPNYHDYYQLYVIYNHRDGWSSVTDTMSSTQEIDPNTYNDMSQWGTKISSGDSIQSGTSDIAEYERDLGAGRKLRTVVILAR